MKLEYEDQEYIKTWVSQRVGGVDLGLGAGIGVVCDGRLVAAVYYNNFRVSPKKRPISIEANVVVIDKKVINRQNLSEFFKYPFIRLGVERVSLTVAKRKKGYRRLIQRLGFQYEGTARKAWHHGEDACVYSLLRNECRWLICP